MKKAIFPGTFDPFTIGHFSVVERALTFMDEIVIGIGINENKDTYFPIEKREKMIRELYKDNPRVQVMSRSEEHTSELQSRQYLVCRLLLEKKNTILVLLYLSSSRILSRSL